MKENLPSDLHGSLKAQAVLRRQMQSSRSSFRFEKPTVSEVPRRLWQGLFWKIQPTDRPKDASYRTFKTLSLALHQQGGKKFSMGGRFRKMGKHLHFTSSMLGLRAWGLRAARGLRGTKVLRNSSRASLFIPYSTYSIRASVP